MSTCFPTPRKPPFPSLPVGQVTLVLDFGRFVIESDPATASKLPGEEAALYECVRLGGRDVSAYMVDGDFDWQKRGGEVSLGERLWGR